MVIAGDPSILSGVGMREKWGFEDLLELEWKMRKRRRGTTGDPQISGLSNGEVGVVKTREGADL